MDKKLYRSLLGKCAQYAKDKFDEGCFAEFGCCPGMSGPQLAGIFKRKGYFFDTWIGVPHFDEVDAATENHRECITRAMRKSKAFLKNKRNFAKEFKAVLRKKNLLKYCKLIKGDICKTAPEFMSDQPDDKFIFAHIDCNMHMPAKVALFELWPHLSVGGIIYFDDYKDPMWPGIEEAIEEFKCQHSGYAFVDLNPLGVNNCILMKDGVLELQYLLDDIDVDYTNDVIIICE